jgi:arginyl-tRNA synthetase
MKELRERGGKQTAELSATESLFEVFESDETRKLVNCLAAFPGEMLRASKDLAPHAITLYAYNLAGCFHAFYNTNRILGEAPHIEAGRLMLAEAVQIVLARCLALVGVSAPERM